MHDFSSLASSWSFLQWLYFPYTFPTWWDFGSLSRILFSVINPMMTTLQGQMSTWTVVKLARYMHSRWMTSFFPVHLDYFVDLSSVLGQPELQHLPNGHRYNVLLLFQLFGKRGRLDLPLKVRRCIEMQFMILALVRSHKGIKLHFGGCHFHDSHKKGRGTINIFEWIDIIEGQWLKCVSI